MCNRKLTVTMKMIAKIKSAWRRLMHNEELKRKLYVIIFEADTPMGKLFDVALIVCIFVSILLAVAESIQSRWEWVNTMMMVCEYLFTLFFTFEYITRIYCSPRPRSYIFSFFGIVDLLATLPLYLAFILPGARYLLVIRAFRIIRVFRIFKLFSFWIEGQMLLTSIQKSARKIAVFFLFVVILVISIGTVMYMIEGSVPDTPFDNIPNSIYWACVTMTTVGYGDITPTTGLGRFLSAVVMLIGYTIIAVPTGIMSVTMMREQRELSSRRCPNCGKAAHDADAEYCDRCGHKLSADEPERQAEEDDDETTEID
jgi:voltage-gated potassium channel